MTSAWEFVGIHLDEFYEIIFAVKLKQVDEGLDVDFGVFMFVDGCGRDEYFIQVRLFVVD